ncbi:MAG: hypothetical protein BZ135_08845 [Methanosphaera sp. rholeuAM6]|nr:MAG: hypothetical protein BZ135_08845 [Methanosphaera sp. rholeuAM6]
MTIGVKVTNMTDSPVSEGIVIVKDTTGNAIAYATLTGGETNITIPAANVGELKVVVEYQENKIYLASNATNSSAIGTPDENVTVINVTKIPTKTTVEVLNTTLGNVTVGVKVTNMTDAPVTKGTVVVKDVSGNEVARADLTSGEATITIPAANVGELKVVVEYQENEIYLASNATNSSAIGTPDENVTVINVTKIPTKTTATVLNNTAGNVTVGVKVTNMTDAPVTEGTVIIKDVNGNELTSKVLANGEATITIPVQKSGKLEVIIEYQENDIYLGSNATSNVNTPGSGDENITVIDVTAQSATITANATPSEVLIGEQVVINGTLVDGMNKPIADAAITVTINGTDYPTTTNAKGEYNVTNVTSTAGVQEVTVSYAGNDTVNATSTTTQFTVNKIPTSTVVQIVNKTVGNVIIDVAVTDKDSQAVTSGQLEITVAGKTTTQNVTGETTRITIDVNSVGDIPVSVKYVENEVYAESRGVDNDTISAGGKPEDGQTLENITTEAQTATITVNATPNKVHIGETVTITGKLVDDKQKAIADAYIEVKVGGTTTITKTDSNGVFTITNVPNAKATVNVTATYKGNSTVNGTTAKTSFEVDKIPTTTLVSIVNTTVGNVSINVEVIDNNNKTVTNGKIEVTTPKETITVNITEGVTNIKLDLDTGDNTVSVKYLENDVYYNSTGLDKVSYETDPNNSETINNITVDKLNTTITVTAASPVKAGNSTIISGKLVDEYARPIEGATVVIYVNQTKVGSTTTDSDGLYTFEFNKTIVGTHNVTSSYDGNNTFIGSNSSTNFTAEITNTHIIIDAIEDVPVGNNVTITGKLEDEFNVPMKSATVKITVGNESQIVTTSPTDGTFSAKFNTTRVGVEDVKVEYLGSPTHNATSSQSTFNVTKRIANITTIMPTDPVANQTVNITGNVTDEDGNGLEGVNVTVTVDGVEYNGTTDANGEYNIPVTDVVTGRNNVTVTITNDTYEAKPIKDNFYVGKINTTVVIDPISNVTVGDRVTVSGTLFDENRNTISGATINVTVDGVTQHVLTDKNGKYKATFNTSEVKTYLVQAEYYGNATYKGDGDATLFNVTKATGNITVTIPTDAVPNEPATVNGTVTDDDGKPVGGVPVNVKVNGETYNTTTNPDGTFNVTVPEEKIVEGNNTITVTAGNDTFTADPVSKTLTTSKVDSRLTVDPIKDTQVGEKATISGKLVDKNGKPIANANITVTVDGQPYTTTTNKDGKYTVKVPTTEIGTESVIVDYAGDNHYNGATVKDKLVVTKDSATISVKVPDNATVGDTVNITGKVTDNHGKALANLPVNVTVNGKLYKTTTSKDGSYSVKVNNLVPGINEVTATGGNDKIQTDTVMDKFETFKINTTTTINKAIKVKVGEQVTITGQISDDKGRKVANANVTVYVDYQAYNTKTDKNGKYELKYTPKSAGAKLVTVEYLGNDTYYPSHNASLVEAYDTPVKQNSTITINSIKDVKVGNNVTVTGKLSDKKTGKAITNAKVKVTVDGKSKVVTTDSKGNYKATFPATSVGQKTVKAEFVGNDNYEGSTASSSFKVAKKNTTVTINSISNVKVGNNVTIKGKLVDETGKAITNAKVKVTVDGKSKVVTTDSKGNYKATLPTSSAGQKVVKVEYTGNDTYNGATASSNFKVIKKNATISIDPIGEAKVGENTTITGKLVDEQNNPISGETVKVNVNGKTYTAITDKNGNYKVNVSNTKVGLNNVTVTFSSDKYNSAKDTQKFEAVKQKVKVTVSQVKGIVGENIKLTAYVTDENGNKVTGGTVVFKLNGRTLREDGRFDTNDAAPKKFTVKNGIVTITMKAELYMLGAQNITASYGGTGKYKSAKGNVASAKITKRTAQISVTVNPATAKQNTDIVFTATLKDVTKNAKNKTCLTTGAVVKFKINGVTIKDASGKDIEVKVTGNEVKYVYHVPRGMAGIFENGDIRDYVVEAVYGNDLFNCPVKNTTVFHVERSKVNVKFTKTTVKNSKLSIKATLTDYQNKNLVGTNKICIKINGVTYKENGKTKYFDIKEGKIDLSGIKVDKGVTVKEVTVVTGDREAYMSARATTTKISTS